MMLHHPYQWEVKYQARNEGGWYDIDEKKKDQKWNAMLMDICYWSILYATIMHHASIKSN